MTAPDLILVNATVLTVDAEDTVAEAVAVAGGLIVAVGTSAEVRALAGPGTAVIDLEGRTLVPGFVDAHSHVSMGAPYIQHAAVHPAPVGDVRTVADIVAKLHESRQRHATAPGGYVIGWGYYPDEMAPGEELTADVLDREFPEHKVLVVHVSGHGGVANTAVLEEAGYVDGCPDPEGGTVVRYPGTRKPNGVLWELAWMPLATPLVDFDDDALATMLHEYARWGVTTAQDGAATLSQIATVREFAANRGLPIDVRSLVVFAEFEEALAQDVFGIDENHFTVQGLKLVLDGSPQGKTAHLTEEYLTGGPSGEEHWHGLAVIDQETTDALVAAAYRAGIQVFAHVNGDAAIDQLVTAHRRAVEAGAMPAGPTVPIHSQVMRLDQIDDYVREGLEPSMFTIHAYLFGDTHVRNLGEARAGGISPMRTAIDKGLHPTNHSDYPVAPINPLLLLWSSMVRRSTGGAVLGEDQRITAAEGLRSLTWNAAYEHRCAHDRGSIEAGKLADLVVLDGNPLEVEVEAVKDIRVLRTLKRGVTVFEA